MKQNSQRVNKILQAAYKSAEKRAKERGLDLNSQEFKDLKEKIKTTVLSEMGMTEAGHEAHEMEMDVEVVEKATNIPFKKEMAKLAEEAALKAIKELVPPSTVTNNIVDYNDVPLKEGLKSLAEKVKKIPAIPDIEKMKSELKDELSEKIDVSLKKNIDMMGMPDFRKLGMGLQAQIDALGEGGDGDVSGPALSVDNELVLFSGTTGKLIKRASGTGVIRTDSGVVSVDSDVTDIVAAGTESAAGKLELATDAETVTGTDTARATTPANITAKMAAPGAIGGTTPDSIIGTTIDANTDFTIGGTVITDNTITDDGTLILNATTAVSFSDKPITNVGDLALDSLTADATNIDLNSPLQLTENAPIMLDAAGSADGKYSGITISGTAGATLAFGDLVYLAAADSRWELADADSATTADRLLGMCVLAAANDGDPTRLLLMGNIRADAAFPSMTIGSPVYVGETAGDVQTAIPTGADNVIRRVGYALTADELYFNPSMDAQTSVA